MIPYRLSLGALYAQTMQVYFRKLPIWLLLAALAQAPGFLWSLHLAELHPSEQLPATVLSVLLAMMVNTVLTGALTVGVVEHLLGRPVSLLGMLSHTLRRLLPLLATGIMVGFLVALGCLLLLVPGIIVAIRSIVAAPAVLMEGASPGEALRRSFTLTSGSSWPLFAAILLAGMVLFAFAVLAGLASLASNPELFARPQELESPILQAVSGTLATSFFSVMIAVAYFQLRQGRENVDAEHVAAQFG